MLSQHHQYAAFFIQNKHRCGKTQDINRELAG